MSKRVKSVIPEFQSLDDILADAIAHEKESYDYYMEASKRTQDSELRRFLVHLAEIELTHRDQLQEQLEILNSNNEMVNDLLYAFGEPPLSTKPQS